jgi:hypothetical protein
LGIFDFLPGRQALELRKVIKLLAKFGIIYVTGSGRHPN